MLSSAWQGNLTLDGDETGERERDGYAIVRVALVARGACFAGIYIEIDVSQALHRQPVAIYLMHTWSDGRDARGTTRVRHVAFHSRGDGSAMMNRHMCSAVLGALHAWEHDSFASVWGLPLGTTSGEFDTGPGSMSGEYPGMSSSGWTLPGR